jgi:superfamily II DNA/RNA helicase
MSERVEKGSEAMSDGAGDESQVGKRTNGNTALSAGMRVLIRGQEWLISKVETNSLHNHAVTCTGISPLVRDYSATFLDDLDDIEPVDPTRTRFVADSSPKASRSHLFIESLLRATAPTDNLIHVGDKAAMDSLPYQLQPAKQALSQPRQRILIADAVGLGKTLEAGILMAELIKRHKGLRILVVTAKSMMAQFQKELWDRFTIPLVSLDSACIQQVRSQIPANANPFSYYDKVIVSIDTLKRDIQYGAALDASYWDIIVIDEAQNVADRGSGSKRAQRTRLAQRLASRSDTLIMLSATPHDGRARSFASLMNMLDPTTLPDPENYSKDDIRQLYIRRFKKDVMSDVSGNFPERKVTQELCRATEPEEAAFDCLTGMNLVMDMHRRSSNAGLFKTLLEKSLFSSPSACIKTIDERLKKLSKTDSDDSSGDADSLESLKAYLERITPGQFSRYARLLTLLRSPQYGWDSKNTRDRIVIFTERIETKKYLEQRLRKDLGLSDGAVASMDGTMSDLEQQKVVERFGSASSSIRILVASDVASEGLNLHYLSHRLIHFDTPWSLMVFQQRNGRIDRYGQQEQPDIRFMAIDSRNEKIKGDAHILEILRDKEAQARDNIGDPALLMGKFDIEEEEAFTRQAIESGESAEAFADSLRIPSEDIDTANGDVGGATNSSQNDAFDPLDWFGLSDNADGNKEMSDTQVDGFETGGSSAIAASSYPYRAADAADNTLMSDYAYVREGLTCPEFSQSVKIDPQKTCLEQTCIGVTFCSDSPLLSWLRRRVPDMEVLHSNMAKWSIDSDYCIQQASGLAAQLRDEHWNQTQYLWELNPVMQWIGTKATSLLYGRGEAPIVGVADAAMDADDIIILMQGTVSNRRAVPVIDEWFGVCYQQGQFAQLLSLSEVWRRTGYRGNRVPGSNERQYINRDGSAASLMQIQQAESLLNDAVSQGRQSLESSKGQYDERANHAIEEQLTRIQQWANARKAVVVSTASTAAVAQEQTQRTDETYREYEQWVNESLTASGEPVIRVAAAFVGAER